MTTYTIVLETSLGMDKLVLKLVQLGEVKSVSAGGAVPVVPPEKAEKVKSNHVWSPETMARAIEKRKAHFKERRNKIVEALAEVLKSNQHAPREVIVKRMNDRVREDPDLRSLQSTPWTWDSLTKVGGKTRLKGGDYVSSYYEDAMERLTSPARLEEAADVTGEPAAEGGAK